MDRSRPGDGRSCRDANESGDAGNALGLEIVKTLEPLAMLKQSHPRVIVSVCLIACHEMVWSHYVHNTMTHF